MPSDIDEMTSAMVSHRVRIADIDQVNGELIEWLKQAYEAA